MHPAAFTRELWISRFFEEVFPIRLHAVCTEKLHEGVRSRAAITKRKRSAVGKRGSRGLKVSEMMLRDCRRIQLHVARHDPVRAGSRSRIKLLAASGPNFGKIARDGFTGMREMPACRRIERENQFQRIRRFAGDSLNYSRRTFNSAISQLGVIMTSFMIQIRSTPQPESR